MCETLLLTRGDRGWSSSLVVWAFLGQKAGSLGPVFDGGTASDGAVKRWGGERMGRKLGVEGSTVRNALSSLGWSGRLLWADGFWSRLLGMMIEPPCNETGIPPVMVLPRCKSVHTCGMRYPLDIAFVDRDGTVLSTYELVRPWRILFNPNASFVIERASTCGYK